MATKMSLMAKFDCNMYLKVRQISRTYFSKKPFLGWKTYDTVFKAMERDLRKNEKYKKKCTSEKNPSFIINRYWCKGMSYGSVSFKRTFWYLQFSKKETKKKINLTTMIPQLFSFIFWKN